MSLDRFFERYAELSLGPEPRALAELYAPTFIIGGPEGSQAFANDSRFLNWLAQVADFNREHGMRALEVVSIEPTQLSPRHTLATVTWGARFDKTGHRRVDFAISCLLEESSSNWQILAYISQADQAAEMTKEGLL